MKKNIVFTLGSLLLAAFLVTGCGLGKGSGNELGLSSGGSKSFAGTYNIEGPDYQGTLTIKKAGEGYKLEWNFPNGQTHYGTGIEMDGVLGVVYATDDGAGVAAYKMKGSKITGIWTPASGEELAYEKSRGVEELKPSKRSIAGVYDVKGEYVNGEDYDNTLTLERSAETFQAYWEWDDGSSFPGTGFVVDNIAVVGFGDEEGAGITVYRIKGSTLDGKWVFTAYDDFEDLDKLDLSPEKAVKQ
jgi:hypothetical protein